MGKFFRFDGKLGRFLTCCADLICLNLLTIICSIPVFTVGVSLSAMYYVLYKMRQDAGGGILKSFFHAFRENFKQGAVLSLASLLFFAILAADYALASRSESSVFRMVLYVLPVVLILGCAVLSWVFPLLSRYRNTEIGIVKCAFAISLSYPGKTLLMMVINLIPIAALFASGKLLAAFAIFGLSLPGYINCGIIKKPFERMETPAQTDDSDKND